MSSTCTVTHSSAVVALFNAIRKQNEAVEALEKRSTSVRKEAGIS